MACYWVAARLYLPTNSTCARSFTSRSPLRNLWDTWQTSVHPRITLPYLHVVENQRKTTRSSPSRKLKSGWNDMKRKWRSKRSLRMSMINSLRKYMKTRLKKQQNLKVEALALAQKCKHRTSWWCTGRNKASRLLSIPKWSRIYSKTLNWSNTQSSYPLRSQTCSIEWEQMMPTLNCLSVTLFRSSDCITSSPSSSHSTPTRWQTQLDLCLSARGLRNWFMSQ